MINVYIDPSSHVYLSNILFREDTIYNRDDCLSGYCYLKKYCRKRNINLNTIDFWDKNKATDTDIYVSHDYKNFIRKVYWRFKNKHYPIIKLDKFKKRILFQGEPPMVMPEVFPNFDSLFKIYDKVFFTFKVDNPKCRHFYLYQTHNEIFPEYWDNSNRKFLTIINTNKSPRGLKKILLAVSSRNGLRYLGYKELLSERLKVIDFFSRTNEIDLYGVDWDKRPFFPYWFYKKSIQKVYKGSVKSKFQKLSEYNFTIAFENSSMPSYVTDKLFDCFYTGTVPIYLGAPDIEEHVPKNCFIDMRDFKNYGELRKFLKSLTKSEIETYKQNARKFLESEKYKPFTKEYFAELFVEAVTN